MIELFTTLKIDLTHNGFLANINSKKLKSQHNTDIKADITEWLCVNYSYFFYFF